MSRIDDVKEKVSELYRARSPHRAEWADWLFENHIFVVAENARRLSDRFGAKEDLAMAAAMLHDVADAVMLREDEKHEEESITIARRILSECAFSEEEISVIVADAIRFHGCHGTNLPQTLEGKVMATADAMAHLQTDFYDYSLRTMQGKEPMTEICEWALKKIERDYQKKIFFDDIRNEVIKDYERVKLLFT